MAKITTKDKLLRRQKGIRKTISGTALKPRIRISRSNKHIFVQAIDDLSAKTLVSESDMASATKANKVDKSTAVGKSIGEKLKKLKIDTAVFDRGGYKYHGRVKAVAEGIREAGIKI